jgi:predicted alpha/beta-hydrolase family hydrolase
MADPGMVRLSRAVETAGFDAVRFNFPYREKGSNRPDPMPVLQASIAAVVARARKELEPRKLVIGGRSMGGRAASMLAAEGFECDGLLLAAYPLHPAGKPEKLRAAHLSRISVPVLCFNGTRDELCRRDLMEQALANTAWQMHWIEGADHSFRVLKSSGRTDEAVFDEIAAVSRDWLSRLGSH